MGHTKIAVIGAGAVGSTTAYALILKNIAAEIMLVDIDEQRCAGEVLDLEDALPFSSCSKIHNVSLDQAKKANIIIICAGIAQKPGQPRTELVKTNKKIVTSIIKDLKPFEKNQIVLMVTNPLDPMTFFALEESELPHNQLFGSGTFLDTIRMKGFLAQKLNVPEESIDAYVLGQHGDAQVPIWSSAKIAEKPLLDFSQLKNSTLVEIEQKTKQKAYEIIKCKGATFFGIAACVSKLCESIVFDQKQIFPVSTYIKEFETCLSMPTVIGKNGIEKIIEPILTKEEKEKLVRSAQKIKETIKEA